MVNLSKKIDGEIALPLRDSKQGYVQSPDYRHSATQRSGFRLSGERFSRRMSWAHCLAIDRSPTGLEEPLDDEGDAFIVIVAGVPLTYVDLTRRHAERRI